MKKSRIFMAAGTLALAITAIFATKANKKFTAPTTAFFTKFSGVSISNSAGLPLTVSTNSGANHRAYAAFYTTGGHVGSALKTSGGKALYYF